MQTELNNIIESSNDENLFSNTTNQPMAAFGMFIHHYDAQKAISRLEKNGFARDDISILAPQKSGRRDFVQQQKTSLKAGAVIGAVIGFFVLGFLGLVLGLGTFTQFLPINQTNTTTSTPSWVLSSIIGAIIGVIYGAASGALVGIGTPRSAAKRYGFYLKEGAIMLSVNLHSEGDRARVNNILEQSSAQDISELNVSEIWKTIVPEKKKLIYS
ncbi:MAG: hypothetical protein H7328_05970 [Bdellovibrio sp.]|nr:hypothetical protein [Bdellovibrio sp.]